MKVLRASGMHVAHTQYLPSVPQKSVARIHQNNIFCNRIYYFVQEMDVSEKTPERLLRTSVAYNISKPPSWTFCHLSNSLMSVNSSLTNTLIIWVNLPPWVNCIQLLEQTYFAVLIHHVGAVCLVKIGGWRGEGDFNKVGMFMFKRVCHTIGKLAEICVARGKLGPGFLATYWVHGAIGHSILRPEDPILTESQSSLGVPRACRATPSLLLLVLADKIFCKPPSLAN